MQEPSLKVDKKHIYQYLRKKAYHEAETLLEDYCKRFPGDPESLYMMGQTQAHTGQLDKAESTFRRVIEMQPDVAVCHGSLGSVLRLKGRLTEAVDAFYTACKIRPEHEDYRLELIECLDLVGQRQDAFEECHRLLEIHPASGPGYQAMAALCQCSQQYDSAVKYYLRALHYSPELQDSHIGLGKIYTILGEHVKARKHFEIVLEKQPDHTIAIAGLASLCERRGDVEEAYQLVRKAVVAGQHQTGIAFVYINICTQVNDCENAMAYAEATLGSLTEDSKRERQILHYALGRRYDKIGQYDKAFEHIRQANSQFPIVYNPGAHTDQITSIIQTFTPAYMMTAPRASNRSARPVFIVGMPRSGTSLLEQVLGCHPEVASAGELEDISNMLSDTEGIILPNGGYPCATPKLTAEQLDSLATPYHDHLNEISPDAKRVTDKMPHNFMALGLIAQLFPGARVINVLRDPLDTCLSIYFQDFVRSHDYATDLTSIGTHYRQYLRLMAHWKNVLDIPIIEVEYRHLVNDLENTTRRLLEFCGLEWNAACLEFHNSNRVVHTASYSQVRKPLYRKSLERWRNYEKYLDDLKSALERDY